jgi:hypothetical protein
MRIIVIALLLLGAHFNLTAVVPGAKALIYWPFGTDTKPLLAVFGAYPNSPTQLLAVLAGASFIAALLALFGWLIPANWFAPLVIVAALASAVLYVLYFGLFALLPLAIDIVLMWGVFTQNWSVNTLA